MTYRPAWILSLIFLTCSTAAAQETDKYGDQLGRVELPVSCNDVATPFLERGLALLHHMTYEGAGRAFATAAEADPQCTMAYWGEALTFIHPLWSDPPTKAKFEKGRALIDRAKRQAPQSDRERAYIAAVASYYAGKWNRDETMNLARFEHGWEAVHRQYPEDPEATAFYALAHLATADPSDKTYQTQKRAGALAERVLGTIPDHPGGHHYVIHAYDVPALAGRALEAARNYGAVAPAVPHALHMPTHIFTRLGLWEESIAWNKRSAAAARNHPMGDAVSIHYLHALDYLAYAYLQRGEDRKAKDILKTLDALEGPFHVEIATPYTLAAAPVRMALERQRWAVAASLEPRTPVNYPWEQFPAVEAITHFARGLGAARSGDLSTARRAVTTLAALRDRAAKTSPYWATQVEVQQRSVDAWLTFAGGSAEKGLEKMTAAAVLEASTEKHPVTPGEVLPARELLGDMLLEMGRHEEAQRAYEAALERSPNRFNSLYGAGRAAEMRGDPDGAAHYYSMLTSLTVNADTALERLHHARSVLASE